jgi:multiple sugar transport system substrate-binding protein
MSLLEKANMVKMYLKNQKKSRHRERHDTPLDTKRVNRIDIFIVIALLLLVVIAPIIIYTNKRIEIAANQVNLYLSLRYEGIYDREMMKALLSEFEEKNPNIRILLTANNSIGPQEADIIIFDEGDFSSLVAANALIELNSFTNYDSGTRQLAIPLVSFMNLLFYNKDILTTAGYAHPPRTRDEFTTYVRTVTRGDFNASGAAISLSPSDRQALSRDIFSWIWANGSNFWTDENVPVLNTRTIVNDIAFLGALNREGILGTNIYETTGEQRIEQFAQGRIAMMIASTRTIPYLRGRMGDDAFGVTTIPDSGTGGKYSADISSIYAGISSNSRYLEEAWAFLVFLTEKSSLFCAALKAVPGVVSDIIPGDYVINDPFYSKAWDIFESARIVEGFSGKPGAEQYKTIFLEELHVFFGSNRSAQETVNVIQRRWNEVEILNNADQSAFKNPDETM